MADRFTFLRMELLPVARRLPAYSRLAWALFKDPRMKPHHKAILMGGIGYLLSPIDLVPGFIPVLGQMDDLTVALWSLKVALRTAPADVTEGHLAAHGLSWELLDADLARMNRSWGLVTRAALWFGLRAVGGAGRGIWRLGRWVLQR